MIGVSGEGYILTRTALVNIHINVRNFMCVESVENLRK